MDTPLVLLKPITVGRMEGSERSARGCNWVTLFLGDIITGTWPSRMGKFQMRQKSMVTGSARLGSLSALQIEDPSSRQRGRPTETMPQILDSNIPAGSNIWS
jgi:hypothetical protein